MASREAGRAIGAGTREWWTQACASPPDQAPEPTNPRAPAQPRGASEPRTLDARNGNESAIVGAVLQPTTERKLTC